MLSEKSPRNHTILRSEPEIVERDERSCPGRGAAFPRQAMQQLSSGMRMKTRPPRLNITRIDDGRNQTPVDPPEFKILRGWIDTPGGVAHAELLP
jgi:hypothetical protein